MSPLAVTRPTDELAAALAVYGPKLLAKVDKNRAKKKHDGVPMSRAQYVAWLTAGALHMR